MGLLVQAVGAGDRAEPRSTRLGRPLERGPVDSDEAETRLVAHRPLEVVEQRPVRIAPDVDPVANGTQHALQGGVHVFDALVIVVGPDAVLGDEQGRTAARIGPGSAQRALQRRGPELVAHHQGGNAGLWSQVAPRPDPRAGVRLNTDEVVSLGCVEELVLHAVADPLEPLLATIDCHVVGHREGDAHRHAGGRPSDRLHRTPVRLDEVAVDDAARLSVTVPARREDPEQPAAPRHDVGLVDRAGPGHGAAKGAGGHLAEPAEALHHRRVLPTSFGGHPSGRREVVEGDGRLDSPLASASH